MEYLIDFIVMIRNFVLFLFGIAIFTNIMIKVVLLEYGVDFRKIKTTKRNRR